MAFGHAVITFTGFSLLYECCLLYEGIAPHPHSVLRRTESSKHCDGKVGCCRAKIPPSFSFSIFFSEQYARTELIFVYITLCVSYIGLLFG